MLLQDVLGHEQHDLIAPEDAALAVDRADPVAVPVEGDAEVAAFGEHQVLELAQVRLDGRVGVMGRKQPVDGLVQQQVPARQALRERGHGLAGGAVAGVPGNLEVPAAVIVLRQALDVAVEHRVVADLAPARLEVPRFRDAPQVPDVVAEEGRLLEGHLEAVVVGRIVGAGHHHAAVDRQGMGRVVEHRRRAAADPPHVDTGRRQALDQRRLQFGRREASVVADRRRRPAAPPDNGAEGPAQRLGVLRREGLADDPADVVVAQDRGVETVRRDRHHTASCRACCGSNGPGRPIEL